MARRRAVLAMLAGVAAAGTTAVLSSCAGRRPAQDAFAGGLVEPSPIPVTINPSALPIGDTMPTGIVADGAELVLYIWDRRPPIHLTEAWYDHASGTTSVDPRYRATRADAGVDSRIFEVRQLVVGDGTLIEYGAALDRPGRITVADAGRMVDARFCRWSADPSLTVWWLRRTGQPVPSSVTSEPGTSSPLPVERFPLITTYDDDGRILSTARLRPPFGRQRQGGA